MNESQIPVRYARALFESAKEKDLLDDVRADMETILNISRVSEFKALLRSPIMKQSQKLRMMEQALAGQVGELTVSLLKLVPSNGREEYIAGIARYFTELYKQHKGIVSATFTTAQAVPKALSDKVRKAAQDALKTPVEMVSEDNEELIGGFVLRIEDQQYDASVAHSLNKIKKELTK
jgi:F-type H+-transporting ATPase subunit delta